MLTGSDGDEELDGGPGPDLIQGQAGADRLIGGTGDAPDELRGGIGPDTLLGGGGDDDLLGQLGDDRLEGGGGEDLLEGGEGVDSLFGGKGGDFLSARDAASERSINCGPKVDFLYADPSDGHAECEGSDSTRSARPLAGRFVSLSAVSGDVRFQLPETERILPAARTDRRAGRHCSRHHEKPEPRNRDRRRADKGGLVRQEGREHRPLGRSCRAVWSKCHRPSHGARRRTCCSREGTSAHVERRAP